MTEAPPLEKEEGEQAAPAAPVTDTDVGYLPDRATDVEYGYLADAPSEDINNVTNDMDDLNLS